MNTLFDSAASGRLCVTLLHSLWQMALLAGVAAAISYFLGRNRVSARYWVHAAALFAGVLAMPLTHALVSDDTPPPARRAAAAPVVSAAAAPAPRLQPIAPPPSARPTPASTSPLAASPSQVERTAPANRVRPEQVWRAAAPWLAGAYLLGVALMLARLTWAAVKLERQGAQATPVVDGPIADTFRALCQRWSVRAAPTLAHAEQIAVPLVVGLLKPTILLPTTALTGLSIGELEMILAHELAHVRRYDAWVNLVQRLAEALCFFNPAAWWLSRRISTLREYCCDEAACAAVAGAGAETHLRYATALLRVVELSRGAASRQQLTAVAASGRTPSELRRRVARLFGEPLREPLRLSRGGAVALVVGTALVLCLPPLAESETQVKPATMPASTQKATPANAQDPKPAPSEANAPSSESAETQRVVLTGRIVLEDGTPATVRGWLYSSASWKTPQRAGSNVVDLSTEGASGLEGDFIDKFECRVPAGTVSLFYFPVEGYAPTALGPFELEPGAERRDLVLTLTPGDSMTLRVLDEQGEPVPDATVVKLPLLNGRTDGPVHEETTDSAGELTLEHLTPETPYAFRVFAPGFQPLRTKPLAIDPAGMTLRLSRAVPATGVVRFPDGTASPGTKLKALLKTLPTGGAIMDPRPETVATTESDGRFSLNELADGSRYLMLIEAMDFNRVVVDDLEAGVEDYQVVLPARRDLVVRVLGDLSGLYKLNGKPYVWVQQRFEAKWGDTGRNSTLFSATAPIEPVEGGGQAIFRGLAIDLRPDAGEQEVEVRLGQDLATTKTAKITRSGPAALVEFDLRPAPSAADQAVAAARRRTFGLQGVPKIAFPQVYRQVEVPDMQKHPDDNLASLWQARDAEVADAQYERNRHETALVWDDGKLALASFTQRRPGESWRQTHYWDGREGWLGENNIAKEGTTKNIYRYAAIDKLTDRIAPFYYPQWAAAGDRLPWPGPTVLLDDPGAEPEQTRYQLVGQQTIDGALCDEYDGPQRHEKVWIDRQSGLVKAVSRYYVSDFPNDELLRIVSEFAERKIDNQKDYVAWYKSLSPADHSAFSAHWSAISWEQATPGNLTVFSDYREVAPGVQWPCQADRVVVHPNHRGDKTFNYSLAKITAEPTPDFDIKDLAAHALPTKGVKVTDRRGKEPVDYVWPPADDEATIEQLRDEKLAAKQAKREVDRAIEEQPIDSVDDALRILTEGPAVDPTKAWARAIKYLADHPEPALPALVAALDQEERDHPISKLAFALRAIGDPRAVPALIRALPRTLLPVRSDYALRIDDDTLGPFMQEHDNGKGTGWSESMGWMFTYNRALGEVVGALHKLTGQAFNEKELNWIHLPDAEPQRSLAQQQYDRVARRWADWWEANWRTKIDDPAYATVGLTAPAADTDSVPAADPGVDPAAEATEEPAAAPQADVDNLRIRILDEAGQPLSGAKLYANRVRPEGVEGERIVSARHSADEAGTILLPVDPAGDEVRLWVGKTGYVPEFVSLHRAVGEERERLPASYEFRLAKGQTIGGVVIDGDGAPIAGARVKVEVTPPVRNPDARESIRSEPRVDRYLSDGKSSEPIVTDTEGRWRISDAPAKPPSGGDYAFSIEVSHSRYISGSNLGDAARKQGVTAADLRTQSAKLTMRPGAVVSGVVTDLDGAPIPKGWIVWSDEPYFFGGDWETPLDTEGRFQTPPLEAGEYPIIVIAPGYSAQRRLVQVGSDATELKFELRPGNHIEIRIVDQAGDPIPSASVYLGGVSDSNTWNRSNALHNQGGSSVPEYGVPRRADERGVYVWDWAPEEPVRYHVGAKGFASQDVRLVPKSEAHVVTLHEPLVAEGVATDRATGEPIAEFQAMPVIVFRPNFYSTRYEDTGQGADGQYELPLKGSGNADDNYRVRFEAEGYRTLVSEASYGPQDGRVTLNVALEPAPARTGRVVDAAGKPVAGAIILEGTPTWVPMMQNSEVESYDDQRIETSDASGRFALNATTEPVRVRVLHDAGFAERLVAPDEESIGELRLEPWASVAGQLIQDGQPVADQWVFFGPLVTHRLGEARFQDSYSARTDAQGRFEMNRLPPVAGSLRARLGPWEDSPLTSSESVPVELAPGQKRDVVLGGSGVVITGKVVPTGRDAAPLDRRWSLNFLISRDRGLSATDLPSGKTPGFDATGPFQPAWLLDPNWETLLAARAHHFVKLAPDGDLRVTGVAPGEYDLVVRLYEQPVGCLVETVGEKVVPVKADASGAIDLGAIDVPCRAGPRPGTDMSAYRFTDVEGRERLVGDMSGRYVLMHVWASWCEPCLATMPEVEAAAQRFGADKAVFVGLNVDRDKPAAKALAERRHWNWAQNYLGDDSDMVRQLAISSVPVYYLIGPDGLLVHAGADAAQALSKLTEALTPRVSMTP